MDIIRRIAQEHPDVADPKALVPFVLQEIEGQERELLERILPQYVASVLRRKRPTSDEVEAWEGFLSERVSAEGTYVFARDADAETLDRAGDRRQKMGDATGRGLDRRGRQFKAIASQMREAGAAVAGDLSPQLAVSTIRELELTFALERQMRKRAEARARELITLRRASNDMRALIDSGSHPVVEHLENVLIELGDRRDALLLKREASATVRDWAREATHG